MRILVLFYSTYGHTFKMAEAVVEGCRSVEGALVDLKRVEEVIPEDILKKIGAFEVQKTFSHIPVCKVDEMGDYDAIIFGTPGRYGNMAGQMRNFLDQAGGLWVSNKLVGKVGSVFTSTGTQHGGQEATIISFHFTLFHLGFIIVGLPYSFQGQSIMNEISGGSPYGASTIAGPTGDRMPSENDLEGARFQGRHVAEITKRLTR